MKSIGEASTKGTRFTRRRFLAGVGAGATYLALMNSAGCALRERTSQASLVQGVSSASPNGAWAFRSRPELSPPRVNVVKEAHDGTATGYIFVSPDMGDAGQGGALIIDDRGQVVWFRPTQVRAMDLKVQNYRGNPVLTWGETSGEYVIFDHSYREIARLRAGAGYKGDHHEFLITPQDTALITIYDPAPSDLTAVGGPERGVAWQGIIQELDIETGDVLFEWHSLDHVDLEETYTHPDEHHDRHGIDYFHINSIDVDHDNNLLVSARGTSAVYKVDRATGEILWRLGGKQSDFEMGPNTKFAYQHDARRQPDGTITIFDNGATVFENGYPKAVEESRAIVLELDEERMNATLVREYTHPGKLHADAAGNMQVLPNTNVLIGWGRALNFSEFSKDGELLFDARLPTGNKSYRAFRFPWNARPTDRPAAVAERTSENEVRVYASWNGATEVATWEVLAGPRPDQLELLASVPRNGFETGIVVRTTRRYLAARARDSSGEVLGTTAAIEPL